jgi:type II secretory pathway pseudopilin PulG
MQAKMRAKRKKGFSLIESLISLSISFIIFISAFEFFGVSRNVFFSLNKQEKALEAATFSLDKMKIDILEAGLGLIQPIQSGLIEGLTITDSTISVRRRDIEIPLNQDLVRGQTRISLSRAYKIKRGQQICIIDSQKGEVLSIFSAKTKSIILASPLEESYLKEESNLILLRRISYFLDEKTNILRRKVNNSPSQPLLEEVAQFDFVHEVSSNLVRLYLILEAKKEKPYEMSILPKNMALAASK